MLLVKQPLKHIVSLSLYLSLFFAINLRTSAQTISLSNWKIIPAGEINGTGNSVSQPGFPVSNWTDAQVPGTPFTAYVAAGKESDPNFGDNIYNVNKAKYQQAFWYRTTFQNTAPSNKKAWLHFDGINKRGDIYFNGQRLNANADSLGGLVNRSRFDITSLLQPGDNVVAVYLHAPPPTPLANAASPTYLSSQGWDWMPEVPGLNMGITGKVYLSYSGAVTIEDPWIRTLSASRSEAVITPSATLRNNGSSSITGVITGTIQPGNIRFSQQVTLAPQTGSLVTFPALNIVNPKLWWPNGYGEPNLYTCNLTFKESTANSISDNKETRFGIRKYTYDSTGGVFHINVNGVRVFLKGGNWGMSEYLLRCRDYDMRVRLHREMNFNIIRNWLGSTTDEEFYEACDKYGIMVWDDFWFNNSFGYPREEKVYQVNVVEKIKRFRNHPSIALWCGSNEGFPPKGLNDHNKESIAVYDGNDRFYQPCSNTGPGFSGSGLWVHMNLTSYFTDPVNFGNYHNWGIRSEIGSAVFPNVESLRKFIPESALWPRNEMWDKHFFSKKYELGGVAGPDSYMSDIARSYDSATNINDFCKRAQLFNLEINKAMFEGWQDRLWNDASGILLWMSQSAYPSMIWQTYDYYLDLTGAFFGAKLACEPVHIQWNCANDSIKVINNTLLPQHQLSATAMLYNTQGEAIPGSRRDTVMSLLPGTAKSCFRMSFDAAPASQPYFLKLILKNRRGKISENLYWRGPGGNRDYTQLNTLPPARLDIRSKSRKLSNGRMLITSTIKNTAGTAFGIRVRLMKGKDQVPVLPVIMNNNYFTLLKGESRQVEIEVDPALLGSEVYKVVAIPYNNE